MNIQMKPFWLFKSQFVIVFLVCLAVFNNAYAGEKFDLLAKTILVTAWPTAKYISSDYDKTSVKDNGDIEIVFKINAESYWTKKPIWLEAIVVIDKDWNLKDLKYGNYRGFFKPGTAAKIALGLVNESMKYSTPTEATTKTTTPSALYFSPKTENIDAISDRNLELTRFVRSYVDAIKTNDLDQRVGFYAPLVDFYSKDSANKSFIRDDIYNHQIKPYPTRDFELRSEPTITWDTPKKVTVSFTIDYLLTKDSGKQITSNRIIEMDLIRKDEGWLIQAEHSKGKDAA